MGNALLSVSMFFKRVGIISRLIFLAILCFLLWRIFIPELKFIYAEEKPRELTIEEVQNTPKDKLPLYFSIENAQLMMEHPALNGVGLDSLGKLDTAKMMELLPLFQQDFVYITEHSIDKHGDTSLRSITYPVYSKSELQKNPNATVADLTCYVLVEESNVHSKEFDVNSYFSDSLFTISGCFDGTTIDKEGLKIFRENGYKVSDNAILLKKGSTPYSLGTAVTYTVLAIILILFVLLSLLPYSLLCKLLGVEPEIVSID